MSSKPGLALSGPVNLNCPSARFPARKSLEEPGFGHARSLNRETISHLGTLDFITARENVVFPGPPVIHGT